MNDREIIHTAGRVFFQTCSVPFVCLRDYGVAAVFMMIASALNRGHISVILTDWVHLIFINESFYHGGPGRDNNQKGGLKYSDVAPFRDLGVWLSPGGCEQSESRLTCKVNVVLWKT
jgi:hypothetical protein